MRTTKPISTISFNSPRYLELKLNELTKSGLVSFWAFIVHQPEDDEGGKKQHCHVYIEPSKMLQTDDIKSQLLEFDPEHPDKPKGCLTFTSSKFDPWYMYALHDKRYLATKGQSRRYHYLHDDIVSSDSDDLLYKAKCVDMLALSPYEDMIQAQRQGFTWADYFARGHVPLPQVKLFEQAWFLLLQSDTDRGGRQGHYNSIDEESGEVKYMPYVVPLESDTAEEFDPDREKPSWYEAHPQGDFVSLDPDEELPW